MLDVLENFQSSVNSNAQIQRIVKGWNTDVLLEESDSNICYRLLINDGKIHQIVHSATPVDVEDDDDSAMKIVGEAAIMRGLFEGKVNGIRANNEGLIAIYGPMGDQVKLDAIALILWGI
jgi:hypothetical protein